MKQAGIREQHLLLQLRSEEALGHWVKAWRMVWMRLLGLAAVAAAAGVGCCRL
jgi:hypothetical protein